MLSGDVLVELHALLQPYLLIVILLIFETRLSASSAQDTNWGRRGRLTR